MSAASHNLPCASSAPLDALTSGFNFGPAVSANQSVGALVAALLSHTGGSWSTAADPSAPHEASKLHLATEKAYHLLGWEPAWQFPDTVRMTASWYLQSANGSDPANLTRSQISEFSQSSNSHLP